jgi:hypothetical protein
MHSKKLKTDILIRSYHKDFDWLHLSLKSIAKFGHDFSNIHIVVPQSDVSLLSSLTVETTHGTTDECDGYLAQQITKLYADTWCDADYVLHVDSDCIFHTDFSPESFMLNGKPVIFREAIVTRWNAISEKTLGWYDNHEYMRKLPVLYPSWIYAEFRKWIKEKHNCELDNWICLQERDAFSEFNTIGQWAYKFHRDAFEWLHPADMQNCCNQYWSWGGLKEDIREEIDLMLL